MIPATADDITAAWLAGVLDRAPLELVAAEPVGGGFGLASEIVRCRLEGPKGSESVIVKMWATEQFGGREVTFYRRFGGRAGIRLPRFHYGAAAGGIAVVVMEDLAPFRQGNACEVLAPVDIAPVARRLGMLHGRWWQHPEPFPPWRARPLADDWFATRRRDYLARFGVPDDPLAAGLIARIDHAHAIGEAELADAPATLIHGDLHLDNVVFKADGPVILDWARAGRGPATHDLADLLFQMVAPEDLDTAYEIYLGAVVSTMSTPLDAEMLHRHLGASLLQRFATWTLGIARWLPATPREEQLIASAGQRCRVAMHAWRDRWPDMHARVLALPPASVG